MCADQNDNTKNLFDDIFKDHQNIHDLGEFRNRKRVFAEEEIKQEMDRLRLLMHTRNKQQPVTAHYFLRNYYKVAAAVAFLILSLGSLTYFFLTHAGSVVSYATAFSETKRLTLPDGSVVTLNANSELRFINDWTEQQDREVWLEGEAFFNVQKKPASGNAKFIVHTAQLDVEVLGTRFNVNNRRDETQVVLNAGKVKLNLEESANEIYMVPGELVEYSKETKVYKKQKINPEVYTSWRKDLLMLDNRTLKDLAIILEDTYGYQIHFADSGIAEKRFTATIPSGHVEMLFPMLAESFNLEISKKKKHIIMEFKE